ncbi:methyltransferase domain-containing protein [Zhihengliuella sp. ISTPL4]|uniref:ParB N-terminal domain-containing protein n=1 Tax=Zhihengliuella sp. ISTPL4 TaxID=2058657 RepID=UPI0013052331|nr:ParB N-terminal domain-containing protein [Zhihengliuella sp. ISTPL4]
MSSQLPVHPFANLLPNLTEVELDELAADIALHGQREPATVWTDADDVTWLLDGRHRARAAARVGAELRTLLFEGTEDEARSLVMSLNVRRRHLSPSQRALAAGALARRQRGGVGGQSAGLPDAPTQAQAARTAGVSERLVRDASAIMRNGDEGVIRAVANGEMSVTAAAATIRATKTDRQAATALFLSHRRSSSSDSWLTPGWVIERALACLGRIDGDVAAAPELNVPAAWSLTAAEDALAVPTWANADGSPSRLWINPPYGLAGRGPQDWTQRAVAEWEAGTVESALLLLPARPGAHWQQELARFPRLEFRGHLTFEPGVGNAARDRWDAGTRAEAPFASILVGVGVTANQLHRHFGDVGVVFVSYSSSGSPATA